MTFSPKLVLPDGGKVGQGVCWAVEMASSIVGFVRAKKWSKGFASHRFTPEVRLGWDWVRRKPPGAPLRL